MLRPVMTLLVGIAFALGCTSGGETDQSETSETEGLDTAAMIAEGAESGQTEPTEDPDHVPVEVSYEARLLIPPSQTLDVKLPPSAQYRASGKGLCRIDEKAGSFSVGPIAIASGNLISFTVTRWKPAGKPYFTQMVTAPGDMGFSLVNDGKDFLDKAEMTASRTGEGGTVQFDAETTDRSYALKGTVKCAKLSPPMR